MYLVNEHRLEGQWSGADPLPQGTTSASRETTYNNNLPSHKDLHGVCIGPFPDIYLITAALLQSYFVPSLQKVPTDMTVL